MHTPGPWTTRVINYGAKFPYVAVKSESMTFGYDRNRTDPGVVCRVEVAPGRFLDQAKVDAKLIAAAPDLLQELTDFHDHAIDQGWHDCEGIPGGCPVQLAINKATATESP